jgi:hypothetical protein
VGTPQGEGRSGRKLLSQREIAVIVFATSGISAPPLRSVLARFTSVTEWSDIGKKNDRAPGNLLPLTVLIKGLTERTAT